jgi:hypothetical protein
VTRKQAKEDLPGNRNVNDIVVVHDIVVVLDIVDILGEGKLSKIGHRGQFPANHSCSRACGRNKVSFFHACGALISSPVFANASRFLHPSTPTPLELISSRRSLSAPLNHGV